MKTAPPARGERAQPSWFQSVLRRLRELAGHGENPREALEELIEEHGPEGLTPAERDLLLNVLAFGEKRVEDVMVPRADIRAIEVGADLEAVVRAMRESGHSRLLVYRGHLDEVIGVVHVRDLLDWWGDGRPFALAEVVRPVHVVPPSMRALELLLRMRESRQHVAVVVDEFGGTDGLVTLHDLVSEIVGEIHDEDRAAPEPELVEHPDGTLEVDARYELEALEARLGLRLLDAEQGEDVHTVGGLVMLLAERIPRRGEVLRHPAGLEIEVVDADPRRVRRVRIRRTVRPAVDGTGA